MLWYETAVDAVTTITDGDANPTSNELQADGTPRRRRGRRGGRRRRRPEGEAAGTLDAANDQSEMDFDDADDVAFDVTSAEPASNDAPETTEAESRQQAQVSPRPAPVVVSAIPVSTAESDFTDLEPITEKAPDAPVQESSQPEAVAVPAAAPVPATPAVEVIPEPVASEPAPEPETVKPVQPEFVEPKPKQTGYIPVAPPSFSMPNAPSSGFDFTVRISPESKED